ncbi:molybdopterin-guanine dinucleotide biosynthesis protein B [Iocasia frigidifontis]|uniref:Molybdopterin-guanine dinucleotide biosynthesis protein B n=1 Tax=Iocasia fonsfrigidae TaxID=2682810 RepID=A0A8A7KLC6_9FIRM|nr:molybdopterin-guanine dinucleotide biosynthesis protein B [Iocasia fonsfrigidae]QTL98894.1 molybdopterin-guanine dinucleotide biosynthesis protein B [Iocasia fonsfrigidae]
MIPIVSIVGWTNSGKTTFITKLIPVLKSRGYRIATIKHNAHKFEIDKEGKDSWRHRQAGAETVILTCKEKIAVVKEIEEEVVLEELVSRYIDQEIDLVIVEGYKTGSVPKIEVFRPDLYEQPVFVEDEVLTRIINREEDLAELYEDQLAEIVMLIENKILK